MKDKFQSMIAKAPQNTGGGNSQRSVLQYESALLIPTVNRRSTDGQSQSNYPLNTLKKAWKYVACMLMVLFMGVGNMWADNASYTFTTSSAFTNDTIKINDYVYLSKRTSHSSPISSGKFDISSTDNYLCANVVSGYKITSVVYTCYTGSSQVSTGKKCYGSASTSYLLSSSKATDFTLTHTLSFPNTKSVDSGAKLIGDVTLDATTVTGNVVSVAVGKKIGKTGDNNANFRVGAITINYVATCSEPAAPTISGDASYTEGETITLTAATNGTNHIATTTYTWYKGDPWTSATKVQNAATAENSGHIFTKTAALSDDGSVYWCEAANGTCKSHNETGKTIAVSPSSAAKHAISYNEASLKGQSVSGYPTEYTEGVGIASFDDLADVTNFHFNGWSPASISASATTDVELTATWVDAYNVTFSYGAGGGTVPTSFQKWEGAKFNLPGQGSMTAPSGKAFDGWKVGTTKYAAGAEYTMGNAAVEFVAQWKNLPTTIFHYQWSGSSTAPTSNEALTATGGTFTFYKSPSSSKDFTTASVTYHTGVSSDMKTVAGTSDRLVTLNSTSNNSYLVTLTGNKYFEEGDTVFFAGYGNFRVGTTHGADDIVAASSALETGSGASDVNVGYFIFPELENNVNTLYFTRDATSGNRGFTAVKVIRPAQKEAKSTVYDLTAVKINGTAISAADLAILKTGEAYLLDLATKYPAGPTVKFARKTTITYEDDSQKVKNDTITVTASEVDSKWQAQATFGTITYTVKMVKVTAATVLYYDGAMKLGEEVVAINGNPADYADYQSKDLSSFVGWYDNSGLTGDAVTIASATITKDTTFYGKWNPVYAQSANFEQWVLDYGKTYDAWGQLGNLGYAGSFTNLLDSLDDNPTKDNRNYAYLGFKVKNESGKQIDFRLANGKTVKIKFGNVTTTPKIQYNKTGSYDDMPITEGVYSYTADGADAYISIKATDNATLIFKQIMIGADPEFEEVALPYLVTFNAGTGTCETAKLAGASVTLPAVTAPEDYTFAGWFDEATGGANKGLAGATYVPTDNVTLYAHFDPVKYTITYAAGLGSGEMAAAEAGWGTEYTALENGFTAPTGYIFAGWTVTGVDGVSSIGNLGSFTMPKGNVTLTAIWEDNSKVAMNVETSEKYATLAEAIAAAEAGQTVQLLQDIEQADGVLIDKDLVLDLNGKTYTCTDGNSYNNRAIKVTAGDVTIKNGTVDALSNDAHTGGCYGGLRIEGGNVTCEEVTFKNYRIYGLGLKVTGGHLELNECTVISEIGGGLEVAGGTAEVNNCNFTQTGLDTTHKWISTCLASSEAGSLTVNGGTYTSEYSSLYIYSTGGDIDVEAGSFTGDVVLTTETTPAAPSVINIKGGDFTNFEVKTPASSNCDINISGGTFDAPVENKYCADGYVPAPEVAPGVYTVEPKDGIEIIGAVVTSNTDATVTGLYKGTASVKLNNKKLDNGDYYFYVTLADGYTFEEGDVMVLDLNAKSDLGTGTKALEITTGVGNISGDVWKSIAVEDYSAGENTIPLKGIAAGQTSIGLKRSANQNAYINGLKVYRPMNPILTAITINGVACDKGEGNTFSITLPEEGTNLASLEVVPTVIRNAAHATTPEAVISNSGAWAEGANTYRVMDKDGDYTDYTITITLQGQAPAPVITTDLADVAYCAGSEPTLTVVATGDELHYAWFKEAGETDEAVGSDQASYTVAGAGTYYVIVTNHVAGKLDASVTSANAVVTLNTPASITIQPTDLKKQTEGANITLSVVAANATGYQWYGCDNKDKENPSLIAGADEAEYEFAAAAGFFYCEVTGLCGTIESNVAEVTIKRTAGCQYINATSGSQANLADGTIMYACGSDGKLSTGNIFATASDNAKSVDAGAVGSINKQYCVVKFPVDVEEITLYGYNGSNREINNLCTGDAVGTDIKVNTAFTAYTKSKANDGDERSMTIEFDEPFAKEKYLFIKYNSALEIYRICYTAAIEKPVIATQPATKIDFAAGDMTATVVVNAVTEGTLKYQWYNADGDVAVEGATSATLTTTEEGTYYVIVRNTLAGHKDYAVKSSEATLAYRQANDATLSALSVSAGALDPTFDKAVVEYRVDLAKGTTTVPTLTATATMAAYGATAVVTNAAEFENYEAISTVLVTAEDGVSKKTYTVHYYVAHAVTTLADVTESTTWDWSLVTKKADGTTISDDGPKLNENEDGLILASYLSGDDFDKLEGNDDAYAIRNSTDKKVYQGANLRMHTTKGGYLSIWAANEGHSMTLNVANAGRDMQIATLTSDQEEYKLYVQAGDVRIYNVSSASKPMRVSKIVFTVDETPNYTRDVTNNIGTLCVEHNVLAGGALGATFYQIASRNETYPDKIDFEEVMPGEELKAGEPYIFRSNTGKIELYYGDSVANDPVAVRGMIGNYAASTLAITEENKSDILYIAQNKLWMCGNLVGDELILNDHRAYIVMSEVPTYADYHAPQTNGAVRRRVTLGMNSTNVATGLEDVQGDNVQATKVLIDGQLYIMYNGTMYNVQGKLVK